MRAIFYALTAIFITYACKKGGNTGTPLFIEPVAQPVLTSDVSFWLTKGDRSALLQKQNVEPNFLATTKGNTTIEIDESQVLKF